MARKYWRASFHADSTASDPPLVKNTRLRSPGASSASRAASSIAGGCAYVQIGKYSSVSACSRAASARSRATVTDLHGEQARQPVEQPVAVGVPDVAALAAGDDVHRRVVAVRAEAGEVHPEVAVGELG